MNAQTASHHVYNLIILDESGSMSAIKAPTISGFNEIVETLEDMESKFPEQKHLVSFVTFNTSGIKYLKWNKETSNLNLINEQLYRPMGGTPLYDAIGHSINRLREDLPAGISYNVLVTVLTDGMENASQEYTGAAIKQMIDELKNWSWTFAYMGANHDVEAAAAEISIKNTIRFEANADDMKKMFDIDKSARMRMAMLTSKMDKQSNFDFNETLYDKNDF